MEKVEEDKPWHGIQFTIQKEAKELFQTSIKCRLGDGKRLPFGLTYGSTSVVYSSLLEI
jgi:hypothetical protein